MPDVFIYRVKPIRKYQSELLLFTDRKGQIIRYGDFEINGVDGDENEAPILQIDIIIIISKINSISRNSILNRKNKPSNNQ